MSDLSNAPDVATEISKPQHQLAPWMTPRRLFILGAMAVIGGGMWMNWGWLAAVGAAPLILALAPCAVMCGLGLCMKGGADKSCAKNAGTSLPRSES